jgi:hypothetical protein
MSIDGDKNIKLFGKENVQNVFILSLFAFSLIKLWSISAFRNPGCDILVAGFALSLVIPYYILVRKQFLPYITFLFICFMMAVFIIIFHNVYNAIIQLSDVHFPFFIMPIKLLFAYFPASLLFGIYKIIKKISG